MLERKDALIPALSDIGRSISEPGVRLRPLGTATSHSLVKEVRMRGTLAPSVLRHHRLGSGETTRNDCDGSPRLRR